MYNQGKYQKVSLSIEKDKLKQNLIFVIQKNCVEHYARDNISLSLILSLQLTLSTTKKK